MADFARIKRNIGKMLSGGASEAEVDQYLSGEGMSADQLRAGPQMNRPSGALATTVDRLPGGENVSGVAAGQPQQTVSTKSTLGDMMESFGSGLVNGAYGLAGLPGDVDALAQRGAQWAGLVRSQDAAKMPSIMPTTSDLKSATSYKGYTPQTRLGRFSQTAGEFIPSVAGGGLGSVLKYGVIPAIASEGAGEVAEGTPLETPARIMGALGAGGLSAIASSRTGAQRILRDAAGELHPSVLPAAQSLMDDAARMGVPLTTAEAVQQVTNGSTRLGDVQRVVEQSKYAGPRIRSVMAARPANVQAAGQSAIDPMIPGSVAPSEIAPRVQNAATNTMEGTRKAINFLAEPYYTASSGNMIPAQDFSRLSADPSFADALKQVRSDRVLGATIANDPDNSIKVVNLVKQLLDESAKPQIGRPAIENLKGSLSSQTGSNLRSVADRASPDYQTARQIVEGGHQTVLDPMQRSPLGQLAAAKTFPDQAAIILPASPVKGQAKQISDALQTVMASDPDAARALAGSRIRQIFDEATQANLGGPNAFGGAKFKAIIAGNSEQGKNLQSIVTTLYGQPTWNGFKRMLDVMGATGQRAAPGSMTEFNKQIAQEMSEGRIPSELVTKGLSPGKWLTAVDDLFERLRQGSNAHALADVLLDPQGANRLADIARLPVTSARAKAMVLGTLYNAARSTTDVSRETNREPQQQYKKGGAVTFTKFAQKRLAELGYDVGSSGKNDDKTQLAIRDLQAKAGLPQTGMVDDKTLAVLRKDGSPTASATPPIPRLRPGSDVPPPVLTDAAQGIPDRMLNLNAAVSPTSVRGANAVDWYQAMRPSQMPQPMAPATSAAPSPQAAPSAPSGLSSLQTALADRGPGMAPLEPQTWLGSLFNSAVPGYAAMQHRPVVQSAGNSALPLSGMPSVQRPRQVGRPTTFQPAFDTDSDPVSAPSFLVDALANRARKQRVIVMPTKGGQ